jgi:site-specific DNA recombinase
MYGRDGLADMLAAAKARKFDVLIVESLDRLSRDIADLPTICKKLKFYGIDLRAVNEGPVTDIHIGVRGIISSIYLKDLGDKVRRHHLGRVAEGHLMGRPTYGYRLAGKPGEPEIDPEQAKIVLRFFDEYARGVSPREMALGLSRDGVLSPNGSTAWSHQTFLGGGGKTGLLRNRLYIGEMVYNRSHSVRNPDGGRVQSRANPEDVHVTTTVSRLMIVPPDLWNAAQRRIEDRAFVRFGAGNIKLKKAGAVRRGDHPLSGLMRCGACGNNMIFTGTSRGVPFVTCSAARTKSACSHRKSYDADRLFQKGVRPNLRAALTDPDRQIKGARAAAAEYERMRKERFSERVEAQKKINNLTVTINRLMQAIETAGQPLEPLVASLAAKDAEKRGLEARVSVLAAEDKVVPLPNMVEDYIREVEQLVEGLNQPMITTETLIKFRNVVGDIVVVPTGYREDYVVELYGRREARLGGVDMFPTLRSAQEIFAEEKTAAVLSTHLTGQVQHGNTRPEVALHPIAVLFRAHNAS